MGLRTFVVGLALVAAALAINLTARTWVSILAVHLLANGGATREYGPDALAVFRASSSLVAIPALITVVGLWILSEQRVLGSAPRLRWWMRSVTFVAGAALALLIAHRTVSSSLTVTFTTTPPVFRIVYWRDAGIYALAVAAPILIGLTFAIFGGLAAGARASDIAARCRRWRLIIPLIVAACMSVNVVVQTVYDSEYVARTAAEAAVRATARAAAIALETPAPGGRTATAPSPATSVATTPAPLLPLWVNDEVLACLRLVTYLAVTAALLTLFLTSLQIIAILNTQRQTRQ